MESYHRIATVALDILTSFVITYLCERAFPSLVVVKTKKLNRLACENDMRLALSETKPQIFSWSTKKNNRNHIDTKCFMIKCSWFLYI